MDFVNRTGNVFIPYATEDRSDLFIEESDFFDASCFGCKGGGGRNDNL